MTRTVKPYPDVLAEWVKHRKVTRRDKNLVAFLAVIDDVKSALAAGYAVKTIWLHMTEIKRIDVSYDTFLNYTNRLIRSPKSVSAPTPKVESPSPSVSPSSVEPKARKPEIAGFQYNPVPDEKELL